MPTGSINPDQKMPVNEILRDYELRYRMMSENITLGLFRMTPGPGNRILSTNLVMARMLGYDSPDELAGKSLADLMILPGDIEELTTGIGQGGSFAGREIRLRRRDGSEIWASVQAWILGTASSPVTMIEGLAQDITEHKVSEQEMQYHDAELSQFALALDQANRKLNLLASITRHDIINQISALMIALQLMQDQCHDEELMKYIRMQEGITHKIHQQILFTKDYHEIGVNSPIWYSVRKGIEDAASLLPLAPGVLTIDSSTDAVIYADPLIEKVFYNLIENALRHGGEQIRITFSSHVENSNLVLVCEDNGLGVPARHKEDIFRRMHFKHTGFGLFLSREILGITGLSIRETGEEGKGARFEITVPRDSYKPGSTAG
jgi:PAS domain S-box-containing protein